MHDNNPIENLNEGRFKKLLLNFERKYNDNQKLRIKHSESPTKFASSETELFASLDELQSVATQPELYHILISKKTIPILLSLLSHENADISAKVIGILQEITDVEEIDEQEGIAALIEELKAQNTVNLIVSNLQRFDHSVKEEAQAINNSLAILDNIVDFDARLISDSDTKPLMEWMLAQMKKLEFNQIKLSIAELLSILLLNGPEQKAQLREASGIDILLQQIAYYRRVAPVTGDEHEFLEQTINCLCTAVLDCDDNRQSFLEEEGIDLIELILREKRQNIKKSNLKSSILKLFNHVVTTDKNEDPIVTQCCERFVQVLGLRVLFPIFLNPKIILSEKVRKREYHLVLDEIEEHTNAIVLAMMKYCQNSEFIQRILIKFAECSYEKFSRLVELHNKYYSLTRDQVNENNEDDTKSGAYFNLRTIDYIILLVCYLSNHYEIYDPNGGETFENKVGKLLVDKPELHQQILDEAKAHLEEVSDSFEEQNTLGLIINHFESLSQMKKSSNHIKTQV